MKFEQMNLIRPILRAVRDVGYTEPTPIQEKTIPPLLRGKDVLGCAQTGTGKTAAFALPILQRIVRDESFDAEGARPIRALILTPTRELALQIYENFTQYGKYLPLRSAVIFGGVNQNPQVEQLRAGVDILVATPGRLNDLIGQGHISLADLRIFVLDEADRMLDMGFIHDVRRVIAKLPQERQTLLFSATMPPQVEEIADNLLRDPVHIKISPVTSTVDSVAQSVCYLEKADKTKLLLHLLNGNGVSNALVFTRTKHGADQVARQLNKNGVKALSIHGDKSQNARQTALRRFKEGDIDVLVATDIAARGIDIVELPTVINYHVPEEAETYIHRIGRTGRAGMEGVAITFCCSDELENFRDIEKLIGRTVPERECPFSVADMQPTKPAPRGQGNRGGNTAPTATNERQNDKPKEKQNDQQKGSGQAGQTNAKSTKQINENTASKQDRNGRDRVESKQGKQARSDVGQKQNAGKQAKVKSGATAEQSAKRKQDVPSREDGLQRSVEKQAEVEEKVTERKGEGAHRDHRQAGQAKVQRNVAKQQGDSRKEESARREEREKQESRVSNRRADSTPRISNAAPARKTEVEQKAEPAVREDRTSREEQGGKKERTSVLSRLLSRRERPKTGTKPADGGDRRYADSGEHDGATGQQIVTNFNRSVWLEFNEPPKRPKKMWQNLTPREEPNQESPKEPPAENRTAEEDKPRSRRSRRGRH
ncbi:MAG: DEAD/DEAH box helicase [Clostridia bacterium]|nr:DEAD/DEAH box helicase [Clostridia bacterium]